MKNAKQVLLTLTFGLPLLVWGVSMGNAVSAAPQQSDASGMPDGPGRDITVATCTKCHAITNITTQHKDADGWTATITKMVGYGAAASDDDLQAILEYLTKNYGLDSASNANAPAASHKINVNIDTAAQLVTELGLTEDESKAVVAYRDKNGNFKAIEDLKKVPNVDGAKFDAHAADLVF